MYLNYIFRLQRHQAISLFNWQPEGIRNREQNTSFPLLGLVSSYKDAFSKINTIMGDTDMTHHPREFIESKKDLGLLSDLQSICNEFEKNNESFIFDKNNAILNSFVSKSNNDFGKFFTSYSEGVLKVLKSLYISDFSQTIPFDMLNSFFNYVSQVDSMTYEEIFKSDVFDEINEIERRYVEKIEENFYNSNFVNRLSKNLCILEAKNQINNNIFEEVNETKDIDSLQGKKIFETQKTQKNIDIENTLNNVRSQVPGINFLENAIYYSNKEDYFNSNICNFGLKIKNLNSFNKDSLILVTANVVDKFNLDRFYFPKIFLFSHLITDVNFLNSSIKDLYEELENIDSNKLIGFYNLNNNINKRFCVEAVSDYSFDQRSSPKDGTLSNFLMNTIQRKFNVNSEEANILSKHLINCHISSNELKKSMNLLYDISIDNDLSKIGISSLAYNILNSLSDVEFYNVFEKEKEKTINQFTFDEEKGCYLLPEMFDVIENQNFAYLFSKVIDEITCLEEVKNVIDSEYYEKFSISLNPREFDYINLGEGIDTLDEKIEEAQKLNDLFKIKCNILDLDNLVESIRQGSINLKKSNREIDDFEIVFKVEIL